MSTHCLPAHRLVAYGNAKTTPNVFVFSPAAPPRPVSGQRPRIQAAI